MANSNTFVDDSRVTVGNATKKTDIDTVAENTDWLREALDTIMSGAAADGKLTAAGNVTINTDALFLDATNKRLGIGTATPGDALNVLGTVTISGAARFLARFGDDTNMAISNGGGIVFTGEATTGSATQTGYAAIWAEKENGTNTNYSGQLHLGTNVNGGTISSDVVIDSTGKVGIGTTSPDGPLHVVDGTASGQTANTSADGLIIDSNGAGTGLTILNSTTGTGGIFFGDTDNALRGRILYAHSIDDMIFYTSGAEQIRIDAAGNVGIGTATFGASLAGGLAIANGTQGAALANAIQIVSEDLSAGNTIPSIRTEGGGIYSAGTPAAATGSIAMKIDGTVYYFTVSTTAAS